MADEELESEAVEPVEKQLEEKIKQLEEEKAYLEDRFLRKHADFENYRKRMVKEKSDAILYANTELIKDLINILDDFERAQKASDAENDQDAITKGVNMISSSLSAILQNKGLVKVNALGKEFDPELHLAISMVEDEEGKISVATVNDEYQSGYKLNERIIRPATVQVINPKKQD